MASWLLEERVRTRRARETVLFPKKQAGRLRVCLVYPNRYTVAMGNLGFQTVYEIFDTHPDVVCERAFLPEPDELSLVKEGDLRSLESFLPVRDADIIAFSVSFETDYWHVVRLLHLIGLPAARRERNASMPLVIAGGPAVFLNPEPLADSVDLFLIGEAEEMLPDFLERAAAVGLADRATLLERVAEEVAGAYVPAFFEPIYDGPRQVDLQHRGPGPARVQRRLIWDLNRFPTITRILSEDAVFGDMMLVEASRGCQWGCRFCAAGYMYRPIRTRGVANLEQTVRTALNQRRTIGLVGAEMASVPGVGELSRLALQVGGRLSPSSLKADCVTPQLAQALSRSGNRSVTIAPEAGSERMRRVINKNLSEADILRAADLLAAEGVRDLKLYFMVGLPTETTADVDAIADLASRLSDQVAQRAGAHRLPPRLTVSVNPFVPKPWTPFQWDPMAPIPELKEKLRRLRRKIAAIPNARLDSESPREGHFQTLLSRGDRRIGQLLAQIHALDGDWWGAIRRWQRDGLADLPALDAFVYRTYDSNECLPWDFIDHRISKSYLWVERRKAFLNRQTPPCDTTTCVACEAC